MSLKCILIAFELLRFLAYEQRLQELRKMLGKPHCRTFFAKEIAWRPARDAAGRLGHGDLGFI